MTTQMQLATQSQLIPVFAGTISGRHTQVCKASDLHRFMEVATKFADWITSRIKRFGFVAGQDFELISEKSEIKNIASEKSEAKRGGDRRSKDYHLSLDMAKELSMVENNDKGREARRYFIGMEQQAIAALQSQIMTPVISRATISPEQRAELFDVVSRRAGGNGKLRRQMWSRHNHHFRITEYKDLLAIHFKEAVQYLEAMELTTPKSDNNTDFLTSADAMSELRDEMLDYIITAQNAAPGVPFPQLDIERLTQGMMVNLLSSQRWMVNFDHTMRLNLQAIPAKASIIYPDDKEALRTLLSEHVPGHLLPDVMNVCAQRFAKLVGHDTVQQRIQGAAL